jgi:hypothetical protein
MEVTNEESYGFTSVNELATDPELEGGSDLANATPDAFALLGAASQKSDFDWRDGFARRPQFWAGRR